MFSSRALLNIGLVVFLIALITIILLSNNEKKVISAFSSLQANDVISIKIEYNNSTTHIIKNDNNWHLSAPINIAADKFRVDAILNILAKKESTHYDIKESDFDKYLLKSAQVTLTLNQQSFLFGSTSSVNNKRYVYTNKKLFLIDDTFYSLITAGYKNLMRRQLLDYKFKITDIKHKHFHIYKESSWKSDKKNINADDIKRFVDNWQHIQAYTVNTAISPYVGDNVYITSADGKTIELIINKSEFNTSVTNPEFGLSYQFDLTAFDSLTKPDFYIIDTEEIENN